MCGFCTYEYFIQEFRRAGGDCKKTLQCDCYGIDLVLVQEAPLSVDILNLIEGRLGQDMLLYLSLWVRMLELLVAGKTDTDIYQRGVSLLNNSSWKEALKPPCGEGPFGSDTAWDFLYCHEIFQEKHFFRGAGRAKYDKQAIEALEVFHSWWCCGEGLAKNDIEAIARETGVFDPLDELPGESWEQFLTLYPIVHFALVYVALHSEVGAGEKKSILKKFMTDLPPRCPNWKFPYDLWLQKTALGLYSHLCGIRRGTGLYSEQHNAEYIDILDMLRFQQIV